MAEDVPASRVAEDGSVHIQYTVSTHNVLIIFIAVNALILHDYLEEAGKLLRLKTCLLVLVSVPLHLEKIQI